MKLKNNFPIKKQQFCSIIEAIKLQDEHDNKCIDALSILLPEDRIVIGYNNNWLAIALMSLLKIIFKDESEWISYWLYDLDFGKQYKKGCVTSNGKNCDISTPEKLYEFLMKTIDG